MGGNWVRACRARRCPICEHDSWCSVSEDGGVAICMRESEGSLKPTANGGHLHRLIDGPLTTPSSELRRRRHLVSRGPAPDWTAAVRRRVAETTDEQLHDLARILGLPDISPLHRLSVFWTQAYRGSWGFPMTRGSDLTVIGIRIRLRGGRKLSAKGGREGVFLPTGLSGEGALLVCEGATDTAAALALRFCAVGRPSATGGTRDIVKLTRGRGVVVVADADGPGRRGAQALASTLLLSCPQVQVIEPPDGVNDLRGWLLAGGTRDDVLQVIEAAHVRKLKIAKPEVCEK